MGAVTLCVGVCVYGCREATCVGVSYGCHDAMCMRACVYGCHDAACVSVYMCVCVGAVTQYVWECV